MGAAQPKLTSAGSAASSAAGTVSQYHTRGRKHLPAIASAFVTGGPPSAATVATSTGAFQAADMYSESHPDSQAAKKVRQVAKTYHQKGGRQAAKHAGRLLTAHAVGPQAARHAQQMATTYHQRGGRQAATHAAKLAAAYTAGPRRVSQHVRVRVHARPATPVATPVATPPAPVPSAAQSTASKAMSAVKSAVKSAAKSAAPAVAAGTASAGAVAAAALSGLSAAPAPALAARVPDHAKRWRQQQPERAVRRKGLFGPNGLMDMTLAPPEAAPPEAPEAPPHAPQFGKAELTSNGTIINLTMKNGARGRFIYSRRLGAGAYGQVRQYSADKREDDVPQSLVAKHFTHPDPQLASKDFAAQAWAAHHIKHNSILRRLFVEAHASNGCIIMPKYLPVKSNHPDAVRIWHETKAATYEVLRAGYVYFDLKIANLLVDHNGHVVLADIGGLAPAAGTPTYVNTFAYPGHTGIVAADFDPLKLQHFGRFVTDWALLQLAFDLLGLSSRLQGKWLLGFGSTESLNPNLVLNELRRLCTTPVESPEMLLMPNVDLILEMMIDQINLAKAGGTLTAGELRAVVHSFAQCAGTFPAPPGMTIEYMRKGAGDMLKALTGIPDNNNSWFAKI